jgi:hypothetical protein
MPLTSPVHNRRFTVVDHYRDNQLKKDNSNNFPNLWSTLFLLHHGIPFISVGNRYVHRNLHTYQNTMTGRHINTSKLIPMVVVFLSDSIPQKKTSILP